jgi:hypothetical protein
VSHVNPVHCLTNMRCDTVLQLRFTSPMCIVPFVFFIHSWSKLFPFPLPVPIVNKVRAGYLKQGRRGRGGGGGGSSAQSLGPQCRRGRKLYGKMNILNENFMTSALFWDITQRIVVIRYRRFGIACRSYLHPISSGLQDL